MPTIRDEIFKILGYVPKSTCQSTTFEPTTIKDRIFLMLGYIPESQCIPITPSPPPTPIPPTLPPTPITSTPPPSPSLTPPTTSTTPSITPTNQYVINIVAGSGGSVSPFGKQTITPSSAQITVTATPNSGYQFSNWTIDSTNAGSHNPISLSYNILHDLGLSPGNYTLTANFTSEKIKPVNKLELANLKITSYINEIDVYGQTLFNGKPVSANVSVGFQKDYPKAAGFTYYQNNGYFKAILFSNTHPGDVDNIFINVWYQGNHLLIYKQVVKGPIPPPSSTPRLKIVDFNLEYIPPKPPMVALIKVTGKVLWMNKPLPFVDVKIGNWRTWPAIYSDTYTGWKGDFYMLLPTDRKPGEYDDAFAQVKYNGDEIVVHKSIKIP
ncbi:MAG: hypothetical protein QXJ23_10595 [Thermofilum sp.]|uniref:InlB B-repeat-containing protein n=1 Tax=Thermofilum sp. TaxID=1961369 RepID=UPI00317D077D